MGETTFPDLRPTKIEGAPIAHEDPALCIDPVDTSGYIYKRFSGDLREFRITHHYICSSNAPIGVIFAVK